MRSVLTLNTVALVRRQSWYLGERKSVFVCLSSLWLGGFFQCVLSTPKGEIYSSASLRCWAYARSCCSFTVAVVNGKQKASKSGEAEPKPDSNSDKNILKTPLWANSVFESCLCITTGLGSGVCTSVPHVIPRSSIAGLTHSEGN